MCNSRSLSPNFTVRNVSKDKLVPGTPITFQRRRHFWVMPGRGPLCKKDQRTYWTRPLCRYVCFYLPVYWSPQERLNTRDLVKDITGKKWCNSTSLISLSIYDLYNNAGSSQKDWEALLLRVSLKNLLRDCQNLINGNIVPSPSLCLISKSNQRWKNVAVDKHNL